MARVIANAATGCASAELPFTTHRASSNRHSRVTDPKQAVRTLPAVVTPTSPVVQIETASKRYGAALAFDGLTLHIPPGQFVAVVGRSGAGKTTLLRCLATATTVSTGRIRVGGEDLATL